MGPNPRALPALIALAILVAVFAAITRQHTKERVRLWLTGWALVLLHALVQFFRMPPEWAKLHLAASVAAVELASVAFVVSVAPKAITWRRQLLLAAALAVPALAYTNAMIWGVRAPAFYYGIVAFAIAECLLLLWAWHRKLSAYVLSMAGSLVVVSGLVVWSIALGREEFGIRVVLAAMNFFAGFLFWYRLRRISAGVLATVFGFFAWGATFPAALLAKNLSSTITPDSEIWNITKYLVAVGMIVTLLEEQILQNEHLAYHDALTGLPNRRLLHDRLVQAMAHADRSGTKVAVLLLDLDDFKDVNDTFGHRIGDEALQQVVLRLATRMRAADTLARTGGDEFTVVSEVADALGAQTLALALETALLPPFKIVGKLVHTGVSIGYALYPEDGKDPVDLCAAADKAMYKLKRLRSFRSASGTVL